VCGYSLLMDVRRDEDNASHHKQRAQRFTTLRRTLPGVSKCFTMELSQVVGATRSSGGRES
jgi:hypothetical protein